MRIKKSIFNKKHLKFFFSIGMSYAMITIVLGLTAKRSFAFERQPPFSYYEVIEQRNIFRPKSEYVAPLNKETFVDASHESGNFILTGIVKIRGNYKAILLDKSTRDGFYVGLNESIGDFFVENIQQDKVILRKGDETHELKLKTPAPRAPASKTVIEQNTETHVTPEQPTQLPNDSINPRADIIKSIRLGIPNVPKN